MEEPELIIPHMGWNKLEILNDCPLLCGLEENSYVYFVHSYKAECNDKIYPLILFTAAKFPLLSMTAELFTGHSFILKKRRNRTENSEEFRRADKMIILPAIDIKDGNCVRLFKGDFQLLKRSPQIIWKLQKALRKRARRGFIWLILTAQKREGPSILRYIRT